MEKVSPFHTCHFAIKYYKTIDFHLKSVEARIGLRYSDYMDDGYLSDSEIFSECCYQGDYKKMKWTVEYEKIKLQKCKKLLEEYNQRIEKAEKCLDDVIEYFPNYQKYFQENEKVKEESE